MKKRKSLIADLFHAVFPVEPGRELDIATVSAVVNGAWVDNCTEPKLFYAQGAARRIFNETVGEYVRSYWRRTGHLPEGYHEVISASKRIYFAPLNSVARRRLKDSSSLSAEGASA